MDRLTGKFFFSDLTDKVPYLFSILNFTGIVILEFKK